MLMQNRHLLRLFLRLHILHHQRSYLERQTEEIDEAGGVAVIIHITCGERCERRAVQAVR